VETVKGENVMILIGENLNVMSKTLGPAMKARDAKPIQETAVAETEAGVDYIDVNIGPARKAGAEIMEWLVQTIQEVTDLPLFLDTTNVEAIEAGLKVHRGKAVINSIMARPERMDALFPLAKKYDAGAVALLWGPQGMPRDSAERGALAAELMIKAAEYGVPNEDLWFDPIVTPVNTQQDQVKGCTEFMMMFLDLAPESKATCGLSNVSNGAPEHLRPILNQTYMTMLQKYGMSSAIVDAFDAGLKAIARGEREQLVNLVRRVMDGEAVDTSSLSKEEADYIKTAKILMAESLYSDSWLEL
jgi:5-methyltetrahydrofolate corrinoid/iron sulfur protein methyltransferase